MKKLLCVLMFGMVFANSYGLYTKEQENPNGKVGLLTFKYGKVCDHCKAEDDPTDSKYWEFSVPIHNYLTFSYGKTITTIRTSNGSGVYSNPLTSDVNSFELQLHLPVYKLWEKN